MEARKNIIGRDDLQWTESGHGEHFQCRRKQLGAAAGSEKLGCSLYELAPGMSAFPAHYHTANEEALYILEGEGTLRLGERRIPVKRGDYVALLPAADAAHRLTNTSDTPLSYLCISTMLEPEVTVYPDSNKLGIVAGAAPGGPREKRTIAKSLRADADVDYWEGEK